MASNISISKPVFSWECQNKLVEPQMFQEECYILFEGPYKDECEDSKASLVLNWFSWQGPVTLKSLEVNRKDYKAIFKALENIFRLETNNTKSHFWFRNMKQKHGLSLYSFWSDMPCPFKCQYGTALACKQLKDQFIFGVTT